jgi:hypothetical protein
MDLLVKRKYNVDAKELQTDQFAIHRKKISLGPFESHVSLEVYYHQKSGGNSLQPNFHRNQAKWKG